MLRSRKIPDLTQNISDAHKAVLGSAVPQRTVKFFLELYERERCQVDLNSARSESD
jgi:hypothetical protein